MDLQALKMFRIIASEGSFSKAAQKLNYAQSNLSTRMAQMERDLQTTLFYRHNRGVSLTPKGELLFQYATDLLKLANEAENALRDDDIVKGTLIIGSMESAAMSFLPDFLSKYHNVNPNVSLIVKTGTTAECIRAVLDYTMDGAFVAGPIQHPELIAKPVREERLMLITDCSFSEVVTPEELHGQTLLAFPEGCSYRRILEQWMESKAFFPQKVIEFDSLGAVIASVSAGLGISLFPESIVKLYVERGALRCHTIPEQYANVPTVFVCRKTKFPVQALQQFLQLL